jgi:hypothetical protein
MADPDPMEIESAKLLANEARDRLRAEGLDDVTFDKLADRFIVEGRGDDVDEFIAWSRDQIVSGSEPDDMSEDSFPASDPPSTWATAGGAAPKPEAR